jgi:hypothetical protein
MVHRLGNKVLSVENTVESVPAHEFRQYVENLHAQVRNKLLKPTLVVLQPHQHPMAKGRERSPHEGDTGLNFPYEVLVGLPARDLSLTPQVCIYFFFVLFNFDFVSLFLFFRIVYILIFSQRSYKGESGSSIP